MFGVAKNSDAGLRSKICQLMPSGAAEWCSEVPLESRAESIVNVHYDALLPTDGDFVEIYEVLESVGIQCPVGGALHKAVATMFRRRQTRESSAPVQMFID